MGSSFEDKNDQQQVLGSGLPLSVQDRGCPLSSVGEDLTATVATQFAATHPRGRVLPAALMGIRPGSLWWNLRSGLAPEALPLWSC